MPTFLLVFEFIGTTELLVIALVALMIFGPRKLPEIGRKLGKGMADFKRASEDFKRTWEFEVETEQRETPSSTDAESSAEPRASSTESARNTNGVAALGDADEASAADVQTISRHVAETDMDGPMPAPLTVARGFTTPAQETQADSAQDETRESADATADATARESVG